VVVEGRYFLFHNRYSEDAELRFGDEILNRQKPPSRHR
jgi:hypothetical protein